MRSVKKLDLIRREHVAAKAELPKLMADLQKALHDDADLQGRVPSLQAQAQLWP